MKLYCFLFFDEKAGRPRGDMLFVGLVVFVQQYSHAARGKEDCGRLLCLL